jgi:membrane-associated phospholipid phosphatase
MPSKSPFPKALRSARALGLAYACAATFTFLAFTDLAIGSAHAATADARHASEPAQGAASVQLWHAAARDAIARQQPNQQAALRLLAYLAWTQDQAAQSLHAAAPNASEAAWSAAIDRASADLLAALQPAQAATWQRLYDALAATRAGAAAAVELAHAEALGAQAAQRTTERAASDGFDAAWTGRVPDAPGMWRSQLQPPRAPHLPQLGRMRTFFLPSGDAVQVGAPPQPGSIAFDAALAEVRQRADASSASAMARAKRWEMTSGSLVAGFWDATAADLARRDGLSGRDTARVLALTLGATLDANIACHEIKYRHWTPRPSQVDPGIRPLVALPNHPSYPSNHACDSGAAAAVLAGLFPRQRTTLDAMAVEAGESRIDGGIHYRFDIDAGLAIGRAAAAAALRAADARLTAEAR